MGVAGHLYTAVVAANVLQGGIGDAQGEVMLAGDPLQAVTLVLLRTWLAAAGAAGARALEQDPGALAVAQTPQHLQGGVQRVVRMGEGAGQHDGVALHGPHFRRNLHGPALVIGAPH